jgi:stage V sporulation protein S
LSSNFIFQLATQIYNQESITMKILRVSGTSITKRVAGAIAGVIRESDCADVQAVGAAAVNQSVKAIALARLYLQAEGAEIVCVPECIDLEMNGKTVTAIRFSVERRA